MNNAPPTDQLFGYDVIDGSGKKLGSIDGVWIDDATDRPEFVAVKTGMLFGKNHLLPIDQAQIDQKGQTLQVPYAADQISGGPSFGTNDELSPENEQEIYSYYGLQRETATSPTGEAAGAGAAMMSNRGSTAGGGDVLAPPAQVELDTAAEELAVGKRQVEAGRLRLRKVVQTEHEEVPVELRREQVSIERVDTNNVDVPDSAFQEQEIDVPVMREEPVVGKTTRVTGGVRLNKEIETEARTVGGDVRREDVEIEGDDLIQS